MDDKVINVGPGDVLTKVPERAAAVESKLRQIGNALEDNYLDLCDLLAEAHDNAYHTVWGFGRFEDWVEQASGLDISKRHAYYCVSISHRVKELGLDREAVKRAKISKIKAILSLDPATQGDEMRQLVGTAPDSTLEQVQEAVRKLRTSAGKEGHKKYQFHVVESAVEVIDEALEMARSNYGSTVRNGEIADASDGQCLEVLAASYLADPNNQERPEFGAEHEEDSVEIVDDIQVEV